MKRNLCIVFLLFFVVSACGTSNKLSREGVDEKEFVGTFLTLMMNSFDNDEEMIAYLSPEYLHENGIVLGQYHVNSYSPVGFSIEDYDAKTGIVRTNIWGEDKSWVHEVIFKLVKEDGRLFLLPGRHSESFVDPWFEVHSYIQE